MANAILCSNKLNNDGDYTVTPPTALSGYPAGNIAIFQPGISTRHDPSATDDSITIVPAGVGSVYGDTFALIGTNLTPSQNLLRYSDDISEATVWTTENASITGGSYKSVSEDQTATWRIQESSTGEHYVEQEWTPPSTRNTSYTHQYSESVTFSFYVKEQANRHFRLRVSQGSDYAYQDFTGSTGAKYGALASSGFTATSTTTDAEDNWHRVSITVSDGMGTFLSGVVTCRFQMLDGSYSTSYASGGYPIDIVCPQVEVASSPSTWGWTASANGALWRIFVWNDATSAIIDDSLWMPVSSADTSQEFVNAFYKASSASFSGLVKIAYRDTHNADGYIEIGTCVLGTSFQPEINVAPEYSIQWNEQGSPIRALGGQIYAPQNNMSRILMMDHKFLTESEALNDAYALQRAVGKSRGVLACVEPGGTYQDRTVIWGLLGSLSPITRRVYSTTLGGNVYQTTWEVIEALP